LRAILYLLALLAIAVATSAAHWLLPPELFPLDLFLLATVLVAMRQSTVAAQLFGAAAGLVQDAFGGGLIGLNALSKTAIGFVVAALRQAVKLEGPPQLMLTVALATATDALVVYAVGAAFGLPTGSEPATVAVRAAANAVVVLVPALYLRRRRRRKSMLRKK